VFFNGNEKYLLEKRVNAFQNNELNKDGLRWYFLSFSNKVDNFTNIQVRLKRENFIIWVWDGPIKNAVR
jgi:hypothetical protein